MQSLISPRPWSSGQSLALPGHCRHLHSRRPGIALSSESTMVLMFPPPATVLWSCPSSKNLAFLHFVAFQRRGLGNDQLSLPCQTGPSQQVSSLNFSRKGHVVVGKLVVERSCSVVNSSSDWHCNFRSPLWILAYFACWEKRDKYMVLSECILMMGYVVGMKHLNESILAPNDDKTSLSLENTSPRMKTTILA